MVSIGVSGCRGRASPDAGDGAPATPVAASTTSTPTASVSTPASPSTAAPAESTASQPSTSAPPTSISALGNPSIPAALEPLVDASVTELDVTRQMLEHVPAAIGDPTGSQRLDGSFLRAKLTRLLHGEITGAAYFAGDWLPAPAEGTIGFNWLMCTDSIGEHCAGSVGNVMASVMECTNSAQRRWAAELVELDGRFAAGLFCEHQPAAALTQRIDEGAGRCAAAYLASFGIDGRRAAYLDATAAEIAAMPADPSEDTIRELLRAHSAQSAARYSVRSSAYAQTDRDVAACVADLAKSLDDPPPASLDGDYGLAVAITGRTYRVSLVLG